MMVQTARHISLVSATSLKCWFFQYEYSPHSHKSWWLCEMCVYVYVCLHYQFTNLNANDRQHFQIWYAKTHYLGCCYHPCWTIFAVVVTVNPIQTNEMQKQIFVLQAIFFVFYTFICLFLTRTPCVCVFYTHFRFDLHENSMWNKQVVNARTHTDTFWQHF